MAAVYGMVGEVRSYNGGKGYGFITGMGDYADTMFSRKELPADAAEIRGQIIEKRQVTFDAFLQPDGRAKATNVVLPYMEGDKCPGAIKSFSHRHGYGFATSSCLPGDIRFQLDAFQPPQQFIPEVSMAGALVLLEVSSMADGKLRATKIQFQTSKIADNYRSGAASWPSGAPGWPSGGYAPVQQVAPAFQKGAQKGGPKGFGQGGYAPVQQVAQAFQQGQKGFQKGEQGAQQGGDNTMMRGTVKSFSDRHGYGFITVPGIPLDVRFGKAEVAGNQNIVPGLSVKVVLATKNDGKLCASTVVPDVGSPQPTKRSSEDMGSSMQQPLAGYSMQQPWGGPPAKQARTVPVTSTQQVLAGAVKSYSIHKGFGFITSPGASADVFFMKSNLPVEVRDTDLAGQSVSYELAIAPDGQHRAQKISIA